ncbi:hypothetical protein Salat_2985600 [Sesamum alatum]|uniref:Uncharacterized protein n=1 Tax=Sesamum alatum TaxID=300844 RepID=A0AAE2C885_9LAMI|nr:hypothetical protein Salat_2985600 [Sesamum alatum]
MSERLKESVLKTEVLIGIPGVRIPLHPRGSPIAVRLKRQRKRWILFWVEGDDPNESTIKGAASYISTQIPSPEASRQSHIRKSLSLRYPSVITKHSGPKGIAAIESKPIESETAAVGVTGVLV